MTFTYEHDLKRVNANHIVKYPGERSSYQLDADTHKHSQPTALYGHEVVGKTTTTTTPAYAKSPKKGI